MHGKIPIGGDTVHQNVTILLSQTYDVQQIRDHDSSQAYLAQLTDLVPLREKLMQKVGDSSKTPNFRADRAF